MTQIDTIVEGKQFLRDNWEKGTNCPCCNQNVKLYDRKLYSTPARGLIELYNMDKQRPGYYHISEIESQRKSGGGDFAKLMYWGLVVERVNGDTSKRTSGFWAITDKGRQFVERRITVPAYVQIFDGKKYGFKGDAINIAQALGKDFNYEELIGENLKEAIQSTLL